jgi:ribonuclease HI
MKTSGAGQAGRRDSSSNASAGASASPSPGEATRPSVILYADGACSGNPGPGGWAAILVNHATRGELELSGFEPETTNNRMEMKAVIEGLLRLSQASEVRVVTDSRYVSEGMRSWVHNWQRNGWRTSDRKPVKNQDLWEELVRLSSLHDLEFEWIQGHAGHAQNERCDQLAVAAYQKLLKGRSGSR